MIIIQEIIYIDDMYLPVILENNDTWYPVSYINKTFLNRKKISSQGLKHYEKYLQKKQIDYSFLNNFMNVQIVNCLNQEGIKLWLSNLKIEL